MMELKRCCWQSMNSLIQNFHRIAENVITKFSLLICLLFRSLILGIFIADIYYEQKKRSPISAGYRRIDVVLELHLFCQFID